MLVHVHLQANSGSESLMEDLNRAQHLIRKSASQLQVDESKILELLGSDEPITLFDSDILPL